LNWRLSGGPVCWPPPLEMAWLHDGHPTMRGNNAGPGACALMN
jgi:hypothetical protein